MLAKPLWIHDKSNQQGLYNLLEKKSITAKSNTAMPNKQLGPIPPNWPTLQPYYIPHQCARRQLTGCLTCQSTPANLSRWHFWVRLLLNSLCDIRWQFGWLDWQQSWSRRREAAFSVIQDGSGTYWGRRVKEPSKWGLRLSEWKCHHFVLCFSGPHCKTLEQGEYGGVVVDIL